MKSILTNEKKCDRCGTRANLHKHHVFGGYGNRSLSEQYGLWVYLCAEHHNMGNDSVHQNKERDIELKQKAQRKFEEAHTREEFMKVFGKNYL